MKITCPYCSNLFNDTLEKCPSCGAPNPGVVRKSGAQPITIEELKQWYADRGLPPYETTRFFIGEDYTKPRAFGIYQDPQSGEFIVYKNKDSGQRAVRYRGSDEAYAVNELYQRLKQEILQQKRANLQSGSTDSKKPKRSGCMSGLLLVIGIPLVFVLLGVIALLFQDLPKDGYYVYEQTLYYHCDHNQPDDHSDWFYCDDMDEWQGPMRENAVPEPLRKNKQAKAYYLSEALPARRPEPDFFDSVPYQDVASDHQSSTGYYQYDDTTYYHLLGDLYSGWYYYDVFEADWYASAYDEIPYELQHAATSSSFYYTPTWDSSTQITDFEDTSIYADYLEEQERASWDDDDDDDYTWDSNDSWDSSGTDWSSDW